jgi:hypothetical protein
LEEEFSWKKAAVQRGVVPGSRGLATVRSRYPETPSEDILVGKLSDCCSDL